jgi:hypothetical protein
MSDFRLVIDIKDVTENDATDLAQKIHDEHGDPFDAPLGDFKISVAKLTGNSTFNLDWEPYE